MKKSHIVMLLTFLLLIEALGRAGAFWFYAAIGVLIADPALRDKIARACVRVLTRQDRDAHRLGPEREDGASAWRSYVEQKAASARRLHYWTLPGGAIELARVVLHDDYRI